MEFAGAKKVVIIPGDRSSGGALATTVLRSLTSAGRLATVFEPNSSVHDETNFIKEIKAFSDKFRPDCLVPIFYPEVLSRHREEFSGVRVLADSFEKLELLDSKIRSYELAASLGIPVPARYYDITDDIKADSFPVVFKRDKGQGGDSVYFPKNKAALEQLVAHSRQGSYIITEYIEGTNVSVDVLRWGDFFFAGGYEVLLPQSKGVSVCRRSIVNEKMSQMAKTVLDELDYQGVCGFDFRRTPDGNLYFLECNPRFGAGLPSQLASGFDMPELLLELEEGHVLEESSIRFKPGILTRNKKAARSYLKKRAESKSLEWRDIRYALLSPAKEDRI